jgi:cell division protein FtsL
MKPRLALFFLALLIGMGYGVYNVKYKVRDLKVESQHLKAEIQHDRESIEVLNAEWAYLVRPNRLEELAARYLKLDVLKPQQVTAMADLDNLLPPLIEAENPATADGTQLAAVRKGR